MPRTKTEKIGYNSQNTSTKVKSKIPPTKDINDQNPIKPTKSASNIINEKYLSQKESDLIYLYRMVIL